MSFLGSGYIYHENVIQKEIATVYARITRIHTSRSNLAPRDCIPLPALYEIRTRFSVSLVSPTMTEVTKAIPRTARYNRDTPDGTGPDRSRPQDTRPQARMAEGPSAYRRELSRPQETRAL